MARTARGTTVTREPTRLTGDDDTDRIIAAALERVDPEGIIENGLTLFDEKLTVRTEERELTVDLRRFERVPLLGLGKASARMARAVEAKLGDRLSGGGDQTRS